MNMTTYRKKSTTSTEGSSSSSSGSSTSETETTETSDESSSTDSSSLNAGNNNNTKTTVEANTKTQVNTRRKSAEFKSSTSGNKSNANVSAATNETSNKHNTGSTGSNIKSRAINSGNQRHQQQRRSQSANSSEDESTMHNTNTTKKQQPAGRSGNNATTTQRRKNSSSSNVTQTQSKQQNVNKSVSANVNSGIKSTSAQQTTISAHGKTTKNAVSSGSSKQQQNVTTENTTRKNQATRHKSISDESDKDVRFVSSSKVPERRGGGGASNKAAVLANVIIENTSAADRHKNTKVANKQQKKPNVGAKAALGAKSTEEELSESQTESADDSESSSSESDATESSNSFTSQPAKAVKGKRAPTTNKMTRYDSDEPQERQQTNSTNNNNNTNSKINPRKLTRSLSTRRKQQLKTPATVDATDSDSDAMADMELGGVQGDKRSLSKSPAKKSATGATITTATNNISNKSTSKVKKETSNNGILQTHQRCMTPPTQFEKKCPIEGCDSSGHLSGNLDKHFLPEACPIYHNMSASECKERANERKLRFEAQQQQQQKQQQGNSNAANATNATSTSSSSSLANQLHMNSHSHSHSFSHSHRLPVNAEQREFLNKIRESRARFRPMANVINADKVKLEKDCTDEDREPSLAGLVPDYDLQLFREAQAIASEKIEEELKDLPVGKGIKYITMGKYKMKVWYQSPYPDDAARLPQMYICEFCLRYQTNITGIKRHAQKCIWRHPPGDEIYRKGKLQVWQVDGKRHKQYCQHLCLLAKFFLDHKTLYYDVEPFLFYIMTLADVSGCHTVGYFSKEKNSFYNVSCILTLPPYQRKGYGRLLIDFSYLLTRVEGKIGSPEKPLSDLGLISYRSYWKDVLLDYLCNRSGNTLSIKDVSQEMAIYSYDIVSTLQALGMMKYWKGKHIVLKKPDVLEDYEERVKRRGNFPKIDDTCLRWSPFVSNVP